MINRTIVDHKFALGQEVYFSLANKKDIHGPKAIDAIMIVVDKYAVKVVYEIHGVYVNDNYVFATEQEAREATK